MIPMKNAIGFFMMPKKAGSLITGWHFPSSAEFLTLINELGGASVAGKHLKESGTAYWNDDLGDNSSGFNGRGVGWRLNTGMFGYIKFLTNFHSTDDYQLYSDYYLGMVSTGDYANYTEIQNIILDKARGYSSRLLKNNSSNPGSVIDIDGNIYSTVKIGSQVWMAENLRVTHFNDGTPIPLVTDNTVWHDLTTPGMCWYDNDVANKAIYGGLYNWYFGNHGL
jgi:uncharacterized protein (TIGR02145 family)